MKKVQRQRGSLTVEAVVILPIYILVLLFVLNFMNIFYTQLAIQEGLNNTAAVIGKYCNVAAVTVGMDVFDLQETTSTVSAVVEPVKGIMDSAGGIVAVFTEDGFNAGSFEALKGHGQSLKDNFDKLHDQFPDVATAKNKAKELGKQLPNLLISGGVELLGSLGVSASMESYLSEMKVNQNLLEGNPGQKIRFHLAIDDTNGPDGKPRYDLVLTAQYTYKAPVFSIFFDSIEMKQSVVVHPWIGGKTAGLRKVF